MHYQLLFLGFGNVGQALARLLLRKRSELQSRYGVTFSVTGIATGSHGRAIHPQGIDLELALARLSGGESLDGLSVYPAPADGVEFIRACPADILFENTPVNYTSGQPAVEHIRTALLQGMHVATANKGPVVHAFQELTDLARQQERKFYFESTVMDGAPVFGLLREALPAAEVHAVYGILNSTTNLILTRMEAGESFAEAVAYAQSIGIAETDPSGDVDGWDAAIKTAALVTVYMGVPMKPEAVARQGIGSITAEDVQRARAEGKRWKLVCSARRDGGEIKARVTPEMVPVSSPLYQVEGTTSIVQVESDVLGKLSLIEADPGPHTTAYGLLADFLNAVRMR